MDFVQSTTQNLQKPLVNVIVERMDFIPINMPNIGKAEKQAVRRVLDSSWLSDSSYDGGKMVKEFESKVRKFLGVNHVIAVNSGTAALHVSLLASNVGPGDEVIVPSFTFLATATAVLACGARPVFVDTKADINIDPHEIEKAITKRTRAIIPVHIFGFPADMQEINEIADHYSITVIEDAAESMGAVYRGRKAGNLGKAGCFSLFSTKVVTSGEGGAVSTNDDEFADRLRLLRNHGMRRGYDPECLGYNYRMPEMTAALASVQMDRLGSFLDARTRNAKYLTERAEGLKGVRFTQQSDDRTHVYYLFSLLLRKNRDRVQKKLNASGIGAGVYFRVPVHKTPLFVELGYAGKKLRNTEETSRHILSLPVHPAMTNAELEKVAGEFEKSVSEL
jgi:perosamine synthetase